MPLQFSDNTIEMFIKFTFQLPSMWFNILGTPFEQHLREELPRLFKDPEPLDYVFNHPIGAVAYYALKKSYKEEDIPNLLPKILSKYDKIRANKKTMQNFLSSASMSEFPVEERMLANAIVLTCRSGEYQYPTSMSGVYKKAGGSSFVRKVGEIIGEPLVYDSEKMLESALNRLQNAFGLDDGTVKRCLMTWRKNRVSVTPSYAGGLAHHISQSTPHPLKEKDIARELSLSVKSVIDNSEKIYRRGNQAYNQ
jgi:hypothetical protein